MLEWADAEDTVETLRRKTAEHYHGNTTPAPTLLNPPRTHTKRSPATPFDIHYYKLTFTHYFVIPLRFRRPQETEAGRGDGGDYGDDGGGAGGGRLNPPRARAPQVCLAQELLSQENHVDPLMDLNNRLQELRDSLSNGYWRTFIRVEEFIPTSIFRLL